MSDEIPEQNNTTSPLRVRRRGQRMTEDERRAAQEKFLSTFSKNANVRAACMAAGIDRSQVYRWQEHDEEFSLKFNIATEEANDMIRAALWRRGVDGIEKPVVSMGKVVYVEDPKKKGEQIPLMERVYSDNLLSLLAKARMPEFREKQQMELSGPNGGPLQSVEIYKVRLPDNGRNTPEN